MNEIPASADHPASETSSTFRKGLQVLMAFDGENAQMTLAEVSRKTGMNRSVARRLVRTLVQQGMLVENQQRFQMTVGVLRLARGFIDGRNIATVIQPILRRASEACSENLSFAMPDGEDATYVAHANLQGGFTLNQVAAGTHVPLAGTAVGMAILAWMAPEQRPNGFDAEFLDNTLAHGYSFRDGGYVKGVSSLAFPVFGGDQQIKGAISAIFPTGKYDGSALLPKLTDTMRQAAIDIGASL